MQKWIAGALSLAVAAAAAQAQAAGSGYRVVDRIPGPDGGWDYLHVDPVNNRVLVAHGTSAMAVDLGNKAVTSLGSGTRLHDAMPVNNGAEILLTDAVTDTATFVDGRTGAVIATIPTGKSPDATTIDPKTGLVLVMDHKGGDVMLLDPKSHKAVGSIPVGGALEAAVIDGAGKAYVNIEDKNEIAVLDLAQRKVVGRYALTGCDGPTGLAYDAQDKLLIAACDGATDVVQASTGKVLQTLPTGKGADGIAYSAKRKLAFVPAGLDGTLSVVSLAGGKAKIVDTVPTQKGARTIALDERSGRLYLPSAQFVPAASGGRPTAKPGTFHLLVVGQ